MKFNLVYKITCRIWTFFRALISTIFTIRVLMDTCYRAFRFAFRIDFFTFFICRTFHRFNQTDLTFRTIFNNWTFLVRTFLNYFNANFRTIALRVHRNAYRTFRTWFGFCNTFTSWRAFRDVHIRFLADLSALILTLCI